jgi:hypothetical protein
MVRARAGRRPGAAGAEALRLPCSASNDQTETP